MVGYDFFVLFTFIFFRASFNFHVALVSESLLSTRMLLRTLRLAPFFPLDGSSCVKVSSLVHIFFMHFGDNNRDPGGRVYFLNELFGNDIPLVSHFVYLELPVIALKVFGDLRSLLVHKT